ncbi:MAG: phytanoyl-CoA dioxygenase family protein [Pseudomonadales bacterium]|nr:phytanoyl-CoA dioxygenase family protein [Pseudomonadales bacterium]
MQADHGSATAMDALDRDHYAEHGFALATAMLGPNVCFTHQQFVVKHPDGPAARTDIPWHQDNGYGQLEPPLDLTVWIALDDCTTENGCLWVLPGSQRLGLLPHDERGSLLAVAIEEQGVPVPMAAGDALLFGTPRFFTALRRTSRTRSLPSAPLRAACE